MAEHNLGASADADQALAVPVEPASSLAPSGFDPSREVVIKLTPAMLEDLAAAASIARLARGYGHGPGAHCGKGERIAGYYYRNADAVNGNVMPAHCIGATQSLILTLERAVRDSDGNPQGGDGTAPSRSDDSAGRNGIAPSPDPTKEPSA